jgi:tripartite-type tricarboxylate transporter receptor subunit TctC
MVIAVLPQLEPYVKSGKAKLLAVTTLHRTAQMPDVPTVSETVAGFDYSSEMGVVVPVGTSPAIVGTLHREIAKALKDPATVARLGNMGATVIGSTPEAYAENIRSNLVKFRQAIQVAGVKAE